MKSAYTLTLLAAVQVLLVACASAPSTPSAEDDARLAKAERITERVEGHMRMNRAR